jgi:TPR repeat protein
MNDNIDNIDEILKKSDPENRFFYAFTNFNQSKSPDDILRNFREFMEVAESGYAPAQYMTAICFKYGIGTKKDHETALRYFRLVADQKSFENANMFGKEFNIIVDAEDESSLEISEKFNNLCRNIIFYSNFNLDYYKILQDSGNKDRFDDLDFLRNIADKDDISAQFYLGGMYYDGQEAPQDMLESMRWSRRAARKGHCDAQFQIGRMYFKGEGVPKENYNKALRYFIMAAEQGHVTAINYVGSLRFAGLGKEKNKTDALHWYEKGAKLGHHLAQFNLGMMYIYERKIGINKLEGFKWIESAANQGLSVAQMTLGRIYEKGECGAAQDFKEALKWYLKAADKRFPRAYAYLGRCFDEGLGTKRDSKESLKRYTLGALLFDSVCQYAVGFKLSYGLGVERDKKKAFTWLMLSAKQGNPLAQVEVKKMFESGEGVTKDPKQASFWESRVKEHYIEEFLDDEKFAEISKNFGDKIIPGVSKMTFTLVNAQQNEKVSKMIVDFEKRTIKRDLSSLFKANELSAAFFGSQFITLYPGTIFKNDGGILLDRDEIIFFPSLDPAHHDENVEYTASRILKKEFYDFTNNSLSSRVRDEDEEVDDVYDDSFFTTLGLDPDDYVKKVASGLLDAKNVESDVVPAQSQPIISHSSKTEDDKQSNNFSKSTFDAQYVYDIPSYDEATKFWQNFDQYASEDPDDNDLPQYFSDQKYTDDELYSFGLRYSTGSGGIEVDLKKSLECFTKAAENDHVQSIVRLGSMHEVGMGVKKDLKKAFNFYLKAANLEDPQGEYKVGCHYLEGIGTKKDLSLAIEYLTQSATNGNNQARYDLGKFYLKGKNVKKDIFEALKWLNLAASEHHIDAQIEYASFVLKTDEGDKLEGEYFDNAVKWAKKVAVKGNTTCQLLVAELYDKGVKVTRDMAEAIKWYRFAAEGDDPASQLTLARLIMEDDSKERKNIDEATKWFRKAASSKNKHAIFELGMHLSKYHNNDPAKREEAISNLTKASELGFVGANKEITALRLDTSELTPMDSLRSYRRAAENGSAESQLYLGQIYLSGINVQKDQAEAAKWFRLAAEQGIPEAQYQLAKLYCSGEVSRNIPMAVKLYTKAADKGLEEAQIDLAEMYIKGDGVGKNVKKAINLYQKAADKGNLKALFKLGTIYTSEDNSLKDKQKGINFLKIAAKEDFSDAQISLGKLYVKSNDVEKISEAALFFNRAAAKGNAEAQFLLSEMYEIGIGMPKDLDLSLKNLLLSAENNHPDALLKIGEKFYCGDGIDIDKGKAFDYLKTASNHNISKAHYYLGRMYYFGEAVPQNYSAAFDSFSHVTANEASSFPDAYYYLGKIYEDGIAVLRDYIEAARLYGVAAKKGYIAAWIDLGKLYESQKKYKDAHGFYLNAINAAKTNESNSALIDSTLSEAYFKLAKLYELDLLGDDIARCKKELVNLKYIDHKTVDSKAIAIEFLKMAAEKNNVESLYMLGIKYFNGEEVPKSIKFAIEYLQKAADQKHVDAQFRLAELHRKSGKIDVAIKYYIEAAESSHAGALLMIGYLYKNNIKFAEKRNLAAKYLQEAASLGNPYAQFELGRMYYFGDGVEQNITESIKLILDSARKNNADALNFLGDMFYYGDILDENRELAIDFYKKAAANNSHESQFKLSSIFTEQKSQNNKYLLNAAKNRDPWSQLKIYMNYKSDKSLADNDLVKSIVNEFTSNLKANKRHRIPLINKILKIINEKDK